MSEFKITEEQMAEMDIAELEDLYRDAVYDELVTQIGDGIYVAMKEYDETKDDTICIMVDFKESALVFAYSAGNEIKSKQDSRVFYEYKINLLGECFKIFQYLIDQGEDYAIDVQVSDWLVDAILETNYAFDDYEIYVYGGYDYKVPSWWYEPFYDPEHRG